MQVTGWGFFVPTTENGQLGGQWSKNLTGSTTAGVTLGVEAGGSTWTLIAQAPPAGKAVAGC
jgi:hypothetical protein